MADESRPGLRGKKGRIERIVERFSQRDEVELMYEDESWFSRYAMPRLRSHGPRGKRTRIPKREAPKSQPQKAVAVYGALTIPEKHICIQCVDEQPRSETTWRFLGSLVDYARRNHRRWLSTAVVGRDLGQRVNGGGRMGLPHFP